MNKKQLVASIIVCAVLACIYAITNSSKGKSWDSATTRKKLITDMEPNAICSAKISRGDHSVNLTKKDGVWTVDNATNYPADFQKISSFIRDLIEIKVVQSLKVGPSQYGRLELATEGKENLATVIEFKDSDKKVVKKILVGKKHFPKPDPDSNPLFGGPQANGRYILVDGDKQPVLIKETLNVVSTDSKDWLDKTFIFIGNIKNISFKNSDGTDTWNIYREKNGSPFICSVKPSKKQEVDKSTISSLVGTLNHLSFDNVFTKEVVKGVKPDTIKVSTFDGFNYTIKLYKKDGKVYITPEVSGTYPKTRTASKDEKADDKKRLDEQFAALLKKRDEKLKREQTYSNWVYEIPPYQADAITKKSLDFVKVKKVK